MPDPRSLAVSCEALKYAYRQSKDGFVISFLVQPHDMPPELALAPVGARVMLAVAEIAADGAGDAAVPSGAAARGEATASTAAADTAKAARSERAREAYWSKAPAERAPMRAGILCDNPRFWPILEKRFKYGHPIKSANLAAMALYEILGIESRAELATNETARIGFERLDHEFCEATGQVAERRG